MKPKLTLIILTLTTLVACGGPTAAPSVNAPTAAPAAAMTPATGAATTDAPAAGTEAAITDAPAAATEAATEAPAAGTEAATEAPAAAATTAAVAATTAPAAAATTAPAANVELPVAPTETPVNDALPTPAAAAATAAATSPPSGQSNAECAPGWVRCQTLADPKITIVGSRLVSQDAMDVVARIYTDMTSRFTSAYPKNKFDGYTIYMTNGEPWSELQTLAPIGTMWSGVDEYGVARGDVLRGGTSHDYLWIEEQLICKRGVATRNAAYQAGKSKQLDNTTRTFDQVIHEFGHAIAFRFGLDTQITQVYRADPQPVERFPWSIQNTFGAPAGKVSDGERAFLNQIFSSSTTYSCDTYALSQVHTVKLEVGKQYALREANNTFRYFKLTSLNNVGKGGPIRIDLCPKPGEMGWITMSDATDLTTVENALAEKLTPKSEPCTPDVAPNGVFTNGSSLPNTAGSNPGQSVAAPTTASQNAATAAPSTTASQGAATAAPSTTAGAASTVVRSAPLKLELGKQYVVRQADNTYEYHQLVYQGTLQSNGATFYRGARCPTPGRMNQINILDVKDIMTVEEALAAKLTITNEPCNTTQVPHGS